MATNSPVVEILLKMRDEASSVAKNFASNMQTLNAQLSQTRTASGTAAGSIGNLTSNVERAAVSFLNANQAIRTMAIGLLGFGSIEVLKKFAQDAASAQLAATAMYAVAEGAGIAREEVAKVDDALQALNIDDEITRKAISKFITSGIAGSAGKMLPEIVKLGEAAKDLSVITQQSTGEAFQQLTMFVQTGRAMALRRAGINVDIKKSEIELAASLNKTREALSPAEKAQARLNATLEALKPVAGAGAQAMATLGKQMEYQSRAADELSQAIGENMTPAFSAVTQEITLLMKELQAVFQQETALAGGQDALVESIHSLGEVVRNVTTFLVEHRDVILKVVAAYLGFKTISIISGSLEKFGFLLGVSAKNATSLVVAQQRLATAQQALNSAAQVTPALLAGVSQAQKEVDIAGKAAVGSMGLFGKSLYALASAIQLVGAAFAGWEIGSWLYDNSVRVRAWGQMWMAVLGAIYSAVTFNGEGIKFAIDQWNEGLDSMVDGTDAVTKENEDLAKSTDQVVEALRKQDEAQRAYNQAVLDGRANTEEGKQLKKNLDAADAALRAAKDKQLEYIAELEAARVKATTKSEKDAIAQRLREAQRTQDMMTYEQQVDAAYKALGLLDNNSQTLFSKFSAALSNGITVLKDLNLQLEAGDIAYAEYEQQVMTVISAQLEAAQSGKDVKSVLEQISQSAKLSSTDMDIVREKATKKLDKIALEKIGEVSDIIKPKVQAVIEAMENLDLIAGTQATQEYEMAKAILEVGEAYAQMGKTGTQEINGIKVEVAKAGTQILQLENQYNRQSLAMTKATYEAKLDAVSKQYDQERTLAQENARGLGVDGNIIKENAKKSTSEMLGIYKDYFSKLKANYQSAFDLWKTLQNRQAEIERDRVNNARTGEEQVRELRRRVMSEEEADNDRRAQAEDNLKKAKIAAQQGFFDEAKRLYEESRQQASSLSVEQNDAAISITEAATKGLDSVLRASGEATKAEAESARKQLEEAASMIDSIGAKVTELSSEAVNIQVQIDQSSVSAAYEAIMNKFSNMVATVRVNYVEGNRLPAQQNATGGYITGPGSGTSDSILSWLSNGEFVIRAAAVNRFGIGFFNALNNMQLPRFATGGAVSGVTMPTPILGSQNTPNMGTLTLNFNGKSARVMASQEAARVLREGLTDMAKSGFSVRRM